MTIAEWRAQAGHAKGTVRNYHLGESTIPVHLMKTPIDKIRAAALRDLYERVTTKHGIARTRLVHAGISGALTHAWRQGSIASNVARRVQPPAPRKRRPTTPSARLILQHQHRSLGGFARDVEPLDHIVHVDAQSAVYGDAHPCGQSWAGVRQGLRLRQRIVGLCRW